MHRSLLIALVFISMAVGATLWLFPKLITGDYADITITKITETSGGQMTLSFSTVFSSDASLVEAFYADNKYLGGGSSTGGGFLGRPGRGSGIVCFDLNPKRSPVTGRFADSPLAGRLLVHEGDQKTLHAGERLYFHDFQTSDGVRHYGYMEVKSSSGS